MPGREQSATQETLLLEYIAQCERHTRERSAVYMHLSSIKPEYRNDTEIKETVKKAEKLAHRYHGEVFHLRNDDLVLVMKGAESALVDDILHRICTTFRHDPLLRTSPESFITHYNLEEEYQDILSFVKVIKHRIELQGGQVSDRPIEVDYDDPGAVRTIISVASPHDFVERMPIYKLGSTRRLDPYVYDMAVTQQAFEEIMLDGVVPDSNPDFVTQAYELLERRLLGAIPHMRMPWPLPWGLSVSLTTLLSAEFMQFHHAWRRSWGPTQEVQPVFFVGVEALRNMDGLHFANKYIAECGYSICLDIDVSARALGIDMDALGFRYLRVATPSSQEKPETLALYEELVKKWRADRLVFTRCDDLDDLNRARQLGAYFIQGKAADAVYAGEESWAA